MAKQLEDIDFFDYFKKNVKFHSDLYADEKIVLDFFNHSKSGKFLCIGANDGLDVTHNLLKLGWHGVYCEPDPYACTELLKTTEKFADQVAIFNVAITPTSQIQKFYAAVGGSRASSLKARWIEKQDSFNNIPIRSIMINTVGFQSLLDFLNEKFDYIQIDAEGMDTEIISSVDWGNISGCRMICTEAGPSVLRQLYKQNKFTITDVTKNNGFYVKNTI